MADESTSPFDGWPVIFKYTREQALDDGVLIDVTETAKEAGFKYPTVVTQGVWSSVVHPPEIATKQGESESGRLWDVLWMCACASRRLSKNHDTDRVDFSVIATNSKGRKETHQLWSLCGPGDTAAPVITIMMVGED